MFCYLRLAKIKINYIIILGLLNEYIYLALYYKLDKYKVHTHYNTVKS